MNKKTAYRLLQVLFFAGLMVVAGCSTVLGPPDSGSEGLEYQDYATPSPQFDLFFEGQPNQGMLNADGGYYLWRTGNTWHVRVAKSDRFRFDSSMKPVFTGEVKVDRGLFVNLARYHVDIQNDVQQRKDNIAFRFRLRNDVEGFDFTVRPFGPRYCVTFDLKMDQNHNPSVVHLGRSMFVPDRMPLTSCVP